MLCDGSSVYSWQTLDILGMIKITFFILLHAWPEYQSSACLNPSMDISMKFNDMRASPNDFDRDIYSEALQMVKIF